LTPGGGPDLAIYWAEQNVRVNAWFPPKGIYTNQPEAFVKQLNALISLGLGCFFWSLTPPLNMTGANLIVDGGRTSW
jgi:hypothetical protein